MPKFSKSGTSDIFRRTVQSLPDFAGTDDAAFEALASHYLSYIKPKLSYIQILGMTERRFLEEIYVKTKLRSNIASSRFIDQPTLADINAASKREAYEHLNIESGKVEVSEIAESEEPIIILGSPGSGKSTTLKRIALSFLASKAATTHLPIYLSLSQVHLKEAEGLIDVVGKELSNANIDNAETLARALHQSGRLALFLDGLDEVPSEGLDALIEAINRFTDTLGGNRIYLSSRTSFYKFWVQGSIYEIADFNKDQVSQFAKNWFSKSEPDRDSFIKEINKHPSFYDICRSPLILTMICARYESKLDISLNKSEIYDYAVRALISEWDSSRRIKRSTKFPEFTENRFIQFLSEIAYETYIDDRFFFDLDFVERRLIDFVSQIIRERDRSDQLVSEVIKFIENKSGILVKRGEKIFSFSHLTFHEYFVALKLNTERNLDFFALATERLADPKWVEIWMLLASLSPDAEPLLQSQIKALGRYGFGQSELRRYLARQQSRSPRTPDPDDGEYTRSLTRRSRGLQVVLNDRTLEERISEARAYIYERSNMEFFQRTLFNAIQLSCEKHASNFVEANDAFAYWRPKSGNDAPTTMDRQNIGGISRLFRACLKKALTDFFEFSRIKTRSRNQIEQTAHLFSDTRSENKYKDRLLLVDINVSDKEIYSKFEFEFNYDRALEIISDFYDYCFDVENEEFYPERLFSAISGNFGVYQTVKSTKEFEFFFKNGSFDFDFIGRDLIHYMRNYAKDFSAIAELEIQTWFRKAHENMDSLIAAEVILEIISAPVNASIELKEVACRTIETIIEFDNRPPDPSEVMSKSG